jgi:2-polyprenyl-3-methyl-5-hydroxy-6-metoxy-1,4-benzoquinol methylase
VTPFEQVSVDHVQAYWDARPCNLRHSDKQVGTRTYFDEVEKRKYFVEPHIPDFADFLRWSGKRVLEVGCGIGTDTINFARHGATVTAVELSERSLDIARERAKVLGLADRITFVHANAEQLSTAVPVEPYDLVYSFGVIHHSPHPDAILTELRQYLRPGGTLKVMVYHRLSWKVLWVLLSYGRGRFWELEKIVAQHSEAQTGCPVTYTYTRNSARRFIERAGFRVTALCADHVFPYRIADYVQYRYVRVWYFRWMPALLFRACERAFGWHLLISAEAN